MFDYTLYIFTHGKSDAPRQLRVYFNIETIAIVRGYLAYQTMWVAVGEELPCQREWANSPRGSFHCCGDGRQVDRRSQKFPRFAWCLYYNIGHFLLSMLLDPRLEDNALGFLNCLEFLEQEILQERIFTNWCLIAKITKISVLRKFPTIRYI